MLTATHKLEFKSGKRTAKTIVQAGTQQEQPTPGRIPRITKMMALAIRLDHLLKSGQVSNQAELARIGHVTRARLTQIMNLNLLAPDIQEDLLLSAPNSPVFITILENEVLGLLRTASWSEQRQNWGKLKQVCSTPNS